MSGRCFFQVNISRLKWSGWKDDFGITGQVKQRLRQQKDSLSTQVCWEILTSGEETYILGWYRQKEIMLACLIDLNQLFAEINDMPKSYSVISFLRWNDGRVIAPQAYRKQPGLGIFL